MNSENFKKNLHQIFGDVFSRLPNDFYHQVVHLEYLRFFNADPASTWCNTQSFGKAPTSGIFPSRFPKLTPKLCKKLNDLIDDLNGVLRIQTLAYANEQMEAQKKPEAPNKGWQLNRLFCGSFDGDSQRSFDGHHFCEPNDKDAKFGLENQLFFGIWVPQKDA